MRPALAVVIWIVLIGGLTVYMQSREQASVEAAHDWDYSGGAVSLRVTTTFDIEPDPFALRTEGHEAAALLVRLNGKEVLKRTDRVKAGVPLKVDDLPGVLAGRNEFYLEANPPLERANMSYAVRVQVLRDNATIADTSLWSEPGSRIADTFSVTVTGTEGEEHSDHE